MAEKDRIPTDEEARTALDFAELVSASDYHFFAARTENSNWDEIKERLMDQEILRFLHAQAGLTTETGEIADIFKKYIFYGKEIDRNHLAEEMGDLLWYLSICCYLVGMNLEEVMRKNIFKLRLRYPESFSNDAALQRADKEDK